MPESSQPTRVLYLVVCAAPPAQAVGELVELLQAKHWTVCIITTPRAAGWVDSASLADQTGYPVRQDYKRPDDDDPLPLANAIAVAPATFNTINKWVAGISDTFALGLLNEAIGLKLPIVVAPYAKSSLATHPAFEPNLRTLAEWGVTVLPNEVIRVGSARDTFNWRPLVDVLDRGDAVTTR